jgi:hypothetical protein
MTELVYPINLPQLPEVLNEQFNIYGLVEKTFTGSKVIYFKPEQVFKKEWCKYMNLDWDFVSLFIRSGKEIGFIHRDNPLTQHQIHWGINWIYGDLCQMDYWRSEDIEQEYITIDAGGKPVCRLETDRLPYKSYTMHPGAYIVNASIPHRAINLGDNLRFAVSLRCQKIRNTENYKTWEEILQNFQHLLNPYCLDTI